MLSICNDYILLNVCVNIGRREMLNPFKVSSQNLYTTDTSNFFKSSEHAGRRIICSFCYLQRIGRGSTIDVWFPSKIHEEIAKRVTSNDPTVLDEMGVKWAAIREFSLIKESDYEEDFNMERFNKCVRDIIKWRGQDGYRVTVIMLGDYTNNSGADELRIHDARIQKELTNLIHIMYMEEESMEYSKHCNEAIKSIDWDCANALPHIAVTLGSIGLTGRGPTLSKKCEQVARKIIKIVSSLPKDQVIHDVAIGLTIPDHDYRNRREKLLTNDEKFSSFHQILRNIFEPLNNMSLDMLHGRIDTNTDILPSGMMTGFGPLRAANDSSYIRVAKHFAL